MSYLVVLLALVASIITGTGVHAQAVSEIKCEISVATRNGNEVEFSVSYANVVNVMMDYGDQSPKLWLPSGENSLLLKHTYDLGPGGSSATYYPQLWFESADESVWYCGGPDLPIVVGAKVFLPNLQR